MRTKFLANVVAHGLLALMLASQTAAAQAAHDSVPPTLEERVNELDQKIRVLDRLRELARDSMVAAAKTQSTVTASKDGFSLRSADGNFQFRARGYFQADERFFVHDEIAPATDNFLLRRARPIIEATVYKYFDFRLMPDFAGTPTIFDAYGEARIRPAFAMRVGKFKPPIGLERLQSATDIRFIERGLPTNLVPSRDLGIQVAGELGGGVGSYALGVFDGVADLGSADGDISDAKDFAGRLVFQPFLKSGPGALRNLGLGVAASTGIERGSLNTTALPSYRTPGQQTFFRYRTDGTVPNTVFADGQRYRISPQGYLNWGRLGLLAEYVVSAQEVRRAATLAQLEHKAWQVASSWLLTGEQASFRSVAPKKPFDRGAGAWGAIELAARYGELDIDDAAFPTFANPASAATKEKAWALGLNWHLVRNVKIMLNYEKATFDGGGPSGDRESEEFVVTRFQTAF